jgi:AcrR family transcriptional regulator
LVTPIHEPTGRRGGKGAATRDPDRRERILDAAAELMARHGYQGVNMSDIGAVAGIVGSGIYRHFDGKNAILVELLDRVVDRLLADAEASLRAGSDPHATLVDLVAGQVRFTMEERTLCQVYLQEARGLPDGDLRRLRWKQRHYVDLWLDVLAAVRPELRPGQSQVLVHAAISAIHSILRHRSGLDAPDASAVLRETALRVLDVEDHARPPEQP